VIPGGSAEAAALAEGAPRIHRVGRGSARAPAAAAGREGADEAGHAALVAQARRRRPARPERREVLTGSLVAAAFLGAALAMLALAHVSLAVSPAALVLLVVGFAVLTRFEIEIASGGAVATQLLFIPMLFVLPLPLVPFCVAAGYLLGFALDVARGRIHVLRAGAVAASAWFAVPPALVLLAAGRPAAWSHWPLYVAVFASQCAADFVRTLVQERLAHRVRPHQLLLPLARVYCFDALLTPVALLAAFASAGGRLSFLALLPLVAIFAELASERRGRLDAEIEAVELDVLARRDPLTGLSNRRQLEVDLRVAAGGGEEWLLALFDLDGFKRFNDTYGHPAGDDLLTRLGDAFSAATGDHGYRLGGDEFCTLTPLPAEVESFLENCTTALCEIGEGYSLYCSYGAVFMPGEADNPSEALRLADTRLYGEKAVRRARGRAAGHVPSR
jgi:diguanylate cyclase (GGDEF)-like protein